MKERHDLDCFGYLSDILFEPHDGPAPTFEPLPRPQTEPAETPETARPRLVSFREKLAS